MANSVFNFLMNPKNTDTDSFSSDPRGFEENTPSVAAVPAEPAETMDKNTESSTEEGSNTEHTRRRPRHRRNRSTPPSSGPALPTHGDALTDNVVEALPEPEKTPPFDPRSRLRQLLSTPERDRSDAQWDEIIELEIQTAPGNKISTNPNPNVAVGNPINPRRNKNDNPLASVGKKRSRGGTRRSHPQKPPVG